MRYFITFIVIALLFCIRCTQNTVEPALNPELINEPDHFEFKITDIRMVTQQLRYQWQNNGINANIENWTDISEGSVTLTLLDEAGQEVFSGDLTPAGNFFSSAGSAGNWTVRVNMVEANGTVHFQIIRRP